MSSEIPVFRRQILLLRMDRGRRPGLPATLRSLRRALRLFPRAHVLSCAARLGLPSLVSPLRGALRQTLQPCAGMLIQRREAILSVHRLPGWADTTPHLARQPRVLLPTSRLPHSSVSLRTGSGRARKQPRVGTSRWAWATYRHHTEYLT